MGIAIFRDRRNNLSLEAYERPHLVSVPEAETAFRRYAGRFVAVLRTATAQAHGNCVAWLAGFDSRQEAERALAEALAGRLRLKGHELTGSDVAKLARRSTGKFVPEWGGPERRFTRISILLHYGRVYTPLTQEGEAADLAAYEAYMVKRAAEEAAAAAAEEARRASEAAEAWRQVAERQAAERRERESRESREDHELVSQLMWRVRDRQWAYQARFLRTRELSRVAAQLRGQGIRWAGLETATGALALARADWFRRACWCNRLLARLRWDLIQAAYRLLEVETPPAILAEALRPRFEAYVARRRARLRRESGAA